MTGLIIITWLFGAGLTMLWCKGLGADTESTAEALFFAYAWPLALILCVIKTFEGSRF